MFSTINNHELNFEAYKSLFEYNPDATYAILPNHKFTLYNQAAVDLLGYTKEEMIGTTFECLVPLDITEEIQSKFKLALAGTNQNFQTTLVTKSGQRIMVSILLVPIQVEGGFKGVIGVTKNITELVTLEELTHGQNLVLEKIAKNFPFSQVLDDIVALFEKTFTDSRCAIMLYDNNKMELQVGSAPLLPLKHFPMLENIDVRCGTSPCKKAILTKQTVISQYVENDPIWATYREVVSNYGLKTSWAIPFYDDGGEVLGTFDVYFGIQTDYSIKQKELLEKASYLTGIAVQHYQTKKRIDSLAYRDPLTNLPNRRSFENEVSEALGDSKNNNLEFCLLFIDLDRFKLINDTYGHDVGDLFLVEVAKRLKNCLDEKDVIARLGGDEFTVLLNSSTMVNTEMVCRRIIDSLANPFTINDIQIFVTPSIGISVYPCDGQSVNGLIKKADSAMYLAKKEGGNSFRFHDNTLALYPHPDSRLNIENQLRKALENDEFSIHYQPKLSLPSGEIMGVESLIRWENPALGNVPPDTFIPIAEESGLIIPIGGWVIEEACRQLRKWMDLGFMDLSISVNLSFRQFRKSDLTKHIESLILSYGIQPSLLEFEITESMTMDIEVATNLLNEMKRLGVRISMDDFGTGYSSFNHLKHFPLDYVKIDKSFINDIVHNRQSEYIVNSIFLMAKAIGFKVIAEGVETKEQFDILNKLNCDAIQGYYFSKPLTIDDFELFYRSYKKE